MACSECRMTPCVCNACAECNHDPCTCTPSAITPLEGRLDCFDGRYRYVCEDGHHVVSSEPFVDICTATPQRADNGVVVNVGPPCGAPIDYRTVDYRGEGG